MATLEKSSKLLKQNTKGLFRNKWKSRVFQLKDGQLRYFASKSSSASASPAKRALDVSMYTAELDSSKPEIFRIVKAGGKSQDTMTLQASTSEEANEWVLAFNESRKIVLQQQDGVASPSRISAPVEINASSDDDDEIDASRRHDQTNVTSQSGNDSSSPKQASRSEKEGIPAAEIAATKEPKTPSSPKPETDSKAADSREAEKRKSVTDKGGGTSIPNEDVAEEPLVETKLVVEPVVEAPPPVVCEGPISPDTRRQAEGTGEIEERPSRGALIDETPEEEAEEEGKYFDFEENDIPPVPTIPLPPIPLQSDDECSESGDEEEDEDEDEDPIVGFSTPRSRSVQNSHTLHEEGTNVEKPNASETGGGVEIGPTAQETGRTFGVTLRPVAR